MPDPRPFAHVATRDGWLRSAHESTFVDPERGAVQLDWEPEPIPEDAQPAPALGGGLAFDAECRLYHSRPDDGAVDKLLWAAPPDEHREPEPFLGAPGAAPTPPPGEFTRPDPAAAPLRAPRGLAVDVDDRLFVAEAGGNRVLVYDLWSGRLLRAAVFAPPGSAGPCPLDVAAGGFKVHVVTDSPLGYYTMGARRGPTPQPLPAEISAPARIACSPSGDVVILSAAATAAAEVWPLGMPGTHFAVPFATDVELERDGVLVVAGPPGAAFLRFSLAPGTITELSPLRARGYDGLGIVHTPEATPRIAFWSAGGLRHAVAARLRYRPQGRVTTFRLDSGEYQTRWGRLFLDACVPEGTGVHAQCIALDEVPDDAVPLPRTPPAKLIHETVRRPDLSPPMPPRDAVETGPLPQPFHRRESGRELPWAQPAPDDPFQTYEAPVMAGPGRYLWVALELRGTTRGTPRIRALRAEYPSHDYLRRIPRVFSRDEQNADFLRRFLAPFEGFLGDLEARAALREPLVMPRAIPAEFLPWLGTFLGLVFDRRWSEEARRALLEETIWLFRRRGTPWALQRMIHLAIGVRPILLEHYRLRGMGAAVLGDEGPAQTAAVVGVGLRAGGQDSEDAFQSHAHRFSVIVPAALTPDTREMIDFILEAHRPAHTLYDVCSVDAGMRVGLGLYLELTSIVGRTGAFTPLRLGGSALGRGTIVGRPPPGGVVGQGRLGRDSRVG